MTVLGSVIEVSERHLQKALEPILVKLCGSARWVSPRHPSNALASISVTVSGRVMEVSRTLLRHSGRTKACCWIVVTPGGTTMLRQPSALSCIAMTVLRQIFNRGCVVPIVWSAGLLAGTNQSQRAELVVAALFVLVRMCQE